MSSNPSRRRILTAGAGAALGAAAAAVLASPALAQTPGRFTSSAGPEETRTLDELYRAALAEGGKLVVYAGGDIATQQDGTRPAFRSPLPGDRPDAGRGLQQVPRRPRRQPVRDRHPRPRRRAAADAAGLHPLEAPGRLLPYKPAGFSKLHPEFRDPDGAWVAVAVVAFSFMYDVAAAGADAPRRRWTWSTRGGRAPSPPPTRTTTTPCSTSSPCTQQAYGWDWVAEVRRAGAAVRPRQPHSGRRGPRQAEDDRRRTAARLARRARHDAPVRGRRRASVHGLGPARRDPQAGRQTRRRQALPELAAVHRASSRRRSTAGRYARTSPPPAGLKPIWEYPNANLDGFPRFMEDRAEVER